MTTLIRKILRFFTEPDTTRGENIDAQGNERRVVFDDDFNDWAQRTTW